MFPSHDMSDLNANNGRKQGLAFRQSVKKSREEVIFAQRANAERPRNVLSWLLANVMEPIFDRLDRSV